jgi:fatty acid desaturase
LKDILSIFRQALMRGFGSLANGFSAEWWSHKHNMHHAFTNIDGRDGDIKLEPLYYLSDPAQTGRPDNPAWRRFQHLYGYPLYAFTYVLWRRQGLPTRPVLTCHFSPFVVYRQYH